MNNIDPDGRVIANIIAAEQRRQKRQLKRQKVMETIAAASETAASGVASGSYELVENKLKKRRQEMNLKTIVAFILFFIVVWIVKGDIKTAAIFSLFFAVTVMLINNMASIYLFLKKNRFNMKSITGLNWKYYSISTIIIGLVYIFLLPEKLIMVSGILILCVSGGLLIVDLIKTLFKL